MAVQKWYILPQSVTVHMGKPDETAENKTVSFPEYMKNTASSEIDPTSGKNDSQTCFSAFAVCAGAYRRAFLQEQGLSIRCDGFTAV